MVKVTCEHVFGYDAKGKPKPVRKNFESSLVMAGCVKKPDGTIESFQVGFAQRSDENFGVALYIPRDVARKLLKLLTSLDIDGDCDWREMRLD